MKTYLLECFDVNIVREKEDGLVVCFNTEPSSFDLETFCSKFNLYGKRFDKDLFKDCWIKFRPVSSCSGCKSCLYHDTHRERSGRGYRFRNLCMLQPSIIGVDCCGGDLIKTEVY